LTDFLPFRNRLIVGYTNASVFNCQTNVTINAGTGSGNIGGVVGGLENRYSVVAPATVPTIVVQYSTAIGNVTGGYEVAGIVGGVYCTTEGSAAVDNCAYVGGTLATTNSGSRSYVGGIVGFLKGYLARSYAEGITLQSAGGHYLAGAVGHAEGTTPLASIYNTYADVVSYSGTDPDYDTPFVATVDNSGILPIYYDVWTETTAGYIQPISPPNTGWGLWLGSGRVAAAALNSDDTIDALNVGSTSGNEYYVEGPSTYPVLAWQTIARAYINPTNPGTIIIPGGGTSLPTENGTGVYVDGTFTGTSLGTKAAPYKTIADALANVDSATYLNTIIVQGPVTISAAQNITVPTTLGVTDLVIRRSSEFPGTLFTITGGTTTVSAPTGNSVTIDGNKAIVKPYTASNAMFDVRAGATLTVNSGVTLQNNYSNSGGAILVSGGTANLAGGNIIKNETELNGGGVLVRQAGTFNFSSGMIGGASTSGNANSSTGNAGGVGVYHGSTFNLSGPAVIQGNTAIGNGGGVYVASSSTFTQGTIGDGPTLDGNTATNGGNLYIEGSAAASTLNTGSIRNGVAYAGGGGVYVDAGGILTLNGLTIANNSAANGGGAYIAAGGSFTVNSGLIQGNTVSGLGSGVYVAAPTSVFTVSPTTGAAFEIDDTIYLSSGTYVRIGAPVANITGNLIVQLGVPATDVLVAQGLGYNLTDPGDLAKFAYVSGTYHFYLENNGIYTE
jgi:hypothetical protein